MAVAGGRLEFELLTLQTKKLQVRTIEELPCWLRWYRICLQCQRPRLDPWIGDFLWRKEWLPAAKSLQSCPTLCDPMDCSLPGFSIPGILQARTLDWVERNGSPLQYSCLENSMDRGAW